MALGNIFSKAGGALSGMKNYFLRNPKVNINTARKINSTIPNPALKNRMPKISNYYTSRPMMKIGRFKMPSLGRTIAAATPFALLSSAPTMANLSTAVAYGGLTGGGLTRQASSLMASKNFFQSTYSPFANTRAMSSVTNMGGLMRQAAPNPLSSKNMMLGIKGINTSTRSSAGYGVRV